MVDIDMVDMDMVDTMVMDMVDTDMVDTVDIFSGVYIFQVLIFFRGGYFSEVNVHRPIFFNVCKIDFQRCVCKGHCSTVVKFKIFWKVFAKNKFKPLADYNKGCLCLFFFCSLYIFAATAVGGSLGGTGTNINHGQREIIAGVRNTNKYEKRYFRKTTEKKYKSIYKVKFITLIRNEDQKCVLD